VRALLIVLLLILIMLQFRLWREVSEVHGLRDRVEQQLEENDSLRERNDALAAEVEDLREGLEAIEERARSELGLIQEGEEFFLVVDPEQVDGDAQP